MNLSKRLMKSLETNAAREGTDVEALAERWLAERESDEMRRRMLEASGVSKPDPMVLHDATCAVTMFDMHAQLSSDGRKRGLWIWLKDKSPDRMRQYQAIVAHDPSRVDGSVNEAALLEWPAVKAFHAAMGKALKTRDPK